MPVYLLWLIAAGVSYVGAKFVSGQWNLFTFWQHLKDFLVSFWGLLTLIVSWCWWCISHIKDATAIVYNVLQTVPHILPGVSHSQASAMTTKTQQFYAMANTFIPLSEFMTFLAAYLGVRLILLIYRFVKSWIPFVS